MNIIYYRNQDGEIDSFEEFAGSFCAAAKKCDEYNEKWQIQSAGVQSIPKGSFVEYLLKHTLEYLDKKAEYNRMLKEMNDVVLKALFGEREVQE